jgi:hypothetical protein
MKIHGTLRANRAVSKEVAEELAYSEVLSARAELGANPLPERRTNESTNLRV